MRCNVRMGEIYLVGRLARILPLVTRVRLLKQFILSSSDCQRLPTSSRSTSEMKLLSVKPGNLSDAGHGERYEMAVSPHSAS
jgi:hypothetical protein